MSETPDPAIPQTSFVFDRDGSTLLTGAGQYIADVTLPNMVEAKFVQSGVARARIRGVDLSAAEQSDGVVFAADGARLKESVDAVLPWVSKVLHASEEAVEDFRVPAYPLLPTDAVNYDGEPVAVVVAEDRYRAEDAAERVVVDYELLEPVLDPERSLAPDCDQLYPDVPGNVALEGRYGSEADPGTLFQDAPLVLRRRYRMRRSGNPPLETVGAVASYEAGRLTIWSTIQRPHVLRLALSDILGLPAARVRVVAPENIGGGFGWKSPMYRETAIVAWLAMRLGRPVRWIEDRGEALLKGIHERDQIWDMVAAFDRDGRIQGIDATIIADVGSVMVDMYGLLPARMSASIAGPYDIPWLRHRLRCAVTNKAPMGVNRAAGRMPAVFALERLMDEASRELGLAPEEIRLRNFVRTFPYQSPLGGVLTDSDYVGAMQQFLKDFRVDERRQEVAQLRAAGRNVGLGLVCCVEICRPLTSFGGALYYNQPQYASVTLRMAADGSVEVFSGDAPQGQARHTTMANVVSRELGIAPHMIDVQTGDTRLSPLTNSNSDVATVCAKAARQLRSKVIAVAAHRLQVPADEDHFVTADSVVTYVPDGRTISFRDIGWVTIMRPFELPDGVDPDLAVTAYVEAPYSPTSFAVHGAVVEVDDEIGKLDILSYGFVGDSGTPLNPRGLETAVMGGIATGISNTLCEEYVYGDDGLMIAGTLKDYAMATSGEMPREVMVGHHDTKTSATRYGHKRAISEGVPSGGPPVLVNAVVDAFDGQVEISTVPMHPGQLWELCQGAARAGSR